MLLARNRRKSVTALLLLTTIIGGAALYAGIDSRLREARLRAQVAHG
jgi:hypothetical protein